MSDGMLNILVEPTQANTGECITVVTDRSEAVMATSQPGTKDHVWIKNLGTDVHLTWSSFWHAGGYALRIRRDMLEPLGRALLAAAESTGDGVLRAPELANTTEGNTDE